MKNQNFSTVDIWKKIKIGYLIDMNFKIFFTKKKVLNIQPFIYNDFFFSNNSVKKYIPNLIRFVRLL